MLTELQKTQIRSFVAILASYHQTIKMKHISIALRAYCAAQSLPYNEALKVTMGLRQNLIAEEGMNQS